MAGVPLFGRCSSAPVFFSGSPTKSGTQPGVPLRFTADRQFPVARDSGKPEAKNYTNIGKESTFFAVPDRPRQGYFVCPNRTGPRAPGRLDWEPWD
jgi:hypothetical protein